ncbi:MAG: ATP-dependent RNA helicase HrpA [Pseudomonadales bacterium]|nr:ATP-dependent RNA helicase HrpA [Pseudomonadales bacterium]
MNNVEFNQLLDKCMIRDRFRFRKRFRQNRKDVDNQKLASSIEASTMLVDQRRQQIPKVSYPDILPVSQRVEEIKKAIESSQVVIIAGETGSGKTTQIPKICLELGRGVHGLIGHTQPRRVAARTVAHRIAEELNVPFGQSVGYQVRFTDKTTPLTHIKVMTDGILLAETQRDRLLEQYDTIIIDEAHERSLNIDFLLGYLKRILPRRPELKLIITSATIDVERFSKHFSHAPVVEVSGRAYDVEVKYRPLISMSKADDSDELMYHGILESLQEISASDKSFQTRGDVLIFLSGERDIRELAQRIRKSDLKGYEVLPLYSRLSVAEQNRVFQKHQNRRIVLATNVAETSLTVPGIRYVIDPGFARISRYSVRSKVQQLPIEPISQASANQRKGRCGRVSEGVCIRLYSEEDFLSRPEFTAPEILRTNLAAVILQMLTLNLGDIAQFPFLEKPERRQINDGYQLLFELRAVGENKKISFLGREMARLPIDLKLARMLLQANVEGCLTEVLTIVSVLATQDPRERPHEHQQAADEAHRRHWHEQSDLMTLINLWQFIESNRQELNNNQFRKFCRKNYLSYMRILEWRENHRQLHLMCKEMKLKENSTPGDYGAIHRAMLAGLVSNIGEKTLERDYLGTRNRRHYIFPGSSQFKRMPKWIMSVELVETTRLFGRMVAQIESDWIEPFAEHLVKKTYNEPYFDPKTGRVLAYEEVMLYGVVIVKKRKVDFGKVDIDQARQIFIQSGLVEQQLNSKAGYYRSNCLLVEEIERLESKSRKKDLLVGSYAVFQFYDQRLPENIASVIDLDTWRKSKEQKNPKLLFLEKDALLKQQPELSNNQFPDKLEVADARLKLDYHFDPLHEDDGVSINIPVAILRQVSKAQLDWLIPGLLEEKCLALIKSLPKAIRKKFVPAPDYAKKVALTLKFDGRDLMTTLAEKLFRLSGTQVDVASFNLDSIDNHLKMNIKVLDEKGHVVASGRDLSALQDETKEKSDQLFSQRKSHEVEEEGLTDWTFGSLPAQVEFSQSNIIVKGYPAIVDSLDTVAIKIVDSQHLAERVTKKGLLRLLMLQLKDQRKYIEKNIPNFEKFALFYATKGPRKELLDDLVDAIFRYCFIEDKLPVNDRLAFEKTLANKTNLVSLMNHVAGLLGDILEKANYIEGLLKTQSVTKDVHADITFQMEQLLGVRFMSLVPLRWLKHYPRYLKAIEYRLDKYQINIKKDDESRQVVSEFQARLGRCDQANSVDWKFRWMIEELRVSLFAQALGTSLPVSAKRLEKEWEKENSA